MRDSTGDRACAYHIVGQKSRPTKHLATIGTMGKMGKTANAESSATNTRSRAAGEFQPAQIPYREDKLKEMIVYIADRTADDLTFGDTKLNKALFFADFFHYGFHGKPITGAEYQKLKFGPAPRRLVPARKALEKEDAVEVIKRGRAFQHTYMLANRKPNTRMFNQTELDLVDEVLDMLRHDTAVSASEFSHQESAGWQLVEMGETIPYETVFVSTTKPPRRAFERGRELAAEHGW
jgi:uncharacterized phage-associated protein